MDDDEAEEQDVVVTYPLPENFAIRNEKKFKVVPLPTSTTMNIECYKAWARRYAQYADEIAELAAKHSKSWPHGRIRRAFSEKKKIEDKLQAMIDEHTKKMEEKRIAKESRVEGEDLARRQKGPKNRFLDDLEKDLKACMSDVMIVHYKAVESDPDLAARTSKSVYTQALQKASELFLDKWLPKINSSSIEGIREEAVKIVLMKGIDVPSNLLFPPPSSSADADDDVKSTPVSKKRSIDKPESQHEAHRKAKAAKSMFVSDEEEM